MRRLVVVAVHLSNPLPTALFVCICLCSRPSPPLDVSFSICRVRRRDAAMKTQPFPRMDALLRQQLELQAAHLRDSVLPNLIDPICCSCCVELLPNLLKRARPFPRQRRRALPRRLSFGHRQLVSAPWHIFSVQAFLLQRHRRAATKHLVEFVSYSRVSDAQLLYALQQRRLHPVRSTTRVCSGRLAEHLARVSACGTHRFYYRYVNLCRSNQLITYLILASFRLPPLPSASSSHPAVFFGED